jgi:tRNA(Ile)-lysidine synthase
LSALNRGLRKSATPRARARLKQTLAGALISLARGRIVIAPAPPRRRRVG